MLQRRSLNSRQWVYLLMIHPLPQNTLVVSHSVVMFFLGATLTRTIPWALLIFTLRGSQSMKSMMKMWSSIFAFPGDFLMFNPRIPHCISSRCREADNVMCLSMYLKSSVIGLNNNLLELTEKQKVMARQYHQLVSTQLNFPHRQKNLSLCYRKFYNSL